MSLKNSIFPILAVFLAGCGGEPQTSAPAHGNSAGSEHEAVFASPTERPTDPFTASNYNDIRVTHAHLDLSLDFTSKVIDGIAVLDFCLLYTSPSPRDS